MKITEFIKKELSGWKNFEIVGLIFIFCLILYNFIVLKDSIIAICSAFCGIMYTIIAGKGKISCYFFGLLGSGFYISLALSNHLWGNALLYMLYFVPMQVRGIFEWKEHLKQESNEIIKTELDFTGRMKFITMGFAGCCMTIVILFLIQDKSPIFDGITTFLSIIGMYFTVKRLIEQWVVWAMVNGLTFTMWLYLVLNGTKAYSTLVMWGFYFVLAVYFYSVWKKEITVES